MTRQTMSATNNIVPCWHLQEICGFNNPGCIPGSGVGRFRRCEGAVPTEKRSALTRNNVWRWRHYDPAKSTTPLYNVTQIVFMWFVGCRKPNILAQGRFIRVFTLLLPLTFSTNLTYIFEVLVNQFTCCWCPIFMISIISFWCVENYKWSSWHWNPVTIKKLDFIFVLHRFHYSLQLNFSWCIFLKVKGSYKITS